MKKIITITTDSHEEYEEPAVSGSSLNPRSFKNIKFSKEETIHIILLRVYVFITKIDQ